jgi:hypothetical protein
MQFPLNYPGSIVEVESANLCRWGGVSLYDQWWIGKPADDILRGLLVLSLKAVTSTKINQYLDAATIAVQI